MVSPTLKAFTAWTLVPYVAVFLVVPGFLFVLGRDSFFASPLYWKGQPLMLALCLLPAICGTVILWLLPIRRALTGILAGASLAAMGIVLRYWIEVVYWGGFEARVDITIGALMLLIPSTLAGGYAGLLRSRERSIARIAS